MDLLKEVSPDFMKEHEPPPVKYLHLNDRVIAYRYLEGKGPTLIYVGGFLSSMEIHKATAIEQYAKNHGRSSIRYDQASVGLSSGIDRKDAYNSVWVQDCLAMMDLVLAKRPVILIASSNGAQISAHIAKTRPDQVKGLVLIGPSVESKIKDWDLAIEKGIVPVEKLEQYNNGGYLSYQTPYGKGYISQVAHERDRQIAIDLDMPISISCPIKVLHAWQDSEIPFEQSLKLQQMVQSPDFDIIFRKDGNHRLMKSRDLTLLTYTIHSLLNELEMQSKL